MTRHSRHKMTGGGHRRGLGVTPLVAAAAVLGTGLTLVLAVIAAEPGGVTGARMQLVKDLAFARNASMQGQRDTYVVVFDVDAQRCHVAAAAKPGKPVLRPDGTPCQMDLNEGQWQGVALSITAMGNDDRIGFGAFGQLDQRTDAMVLLSTEQEDVEIRVSAQDGLTAWRSIDRSAD